MTVIKLLNPTILICLLSLSQMFSLFAAETPTAWAQTSWGMTNEQVKELYPDAVPSATIATNLVIRSFEIEGTLYTVFLDFEGGGLSKVSLSASLPTLEALNRSADDLGILLGEKYGEPTIEKGNSEVKASWTSPNAKVALTSSTLLGKAFLLEVIYTPGTMKTLSRSSLNKL